MTKRSYRITIEAKETSPHRWEAIAITEGGDKANGQGSSCDVACSRAAQNLVLAMTSTEPETNESVSRDDREGKIYYINAGKYHCGETCKFNRSLAVLEGKGEVVEVRYSDGTTGNERMKFLELIANQSSGPTPMVKYPLTVRKRTGASKK